MAIPSIPVRILVRTRLAHLEKIHPSLFDADTKLIEKFCTQLCVADTTKIHHLITKISDDKRSERVDIVFDYGVPANEPRPQVIAFTVKVGNSALIIKELYNPRIQAKVNETVEWWREINHKHNESFPSRTDVRSSRRCSLTQSSAV